MLSFAADLDRQKRPSGRYTIAGKKHCFEHQAVQAPFDRFVAKHGF
jgi:hypothetical protein